MDKSFKIIPRKSSKLLQRKARETKYLFWTILDLCFETIHLEKQTLQVHQSPRETIEQLEGKVQVEIQAT